MQNSVNEIGDTALEESWLKEQEVPPLNELILYMGADLAFADSNKSDFTVITSAGLHRKTNTIYLLKQHRSRSSLPQTIENLKNEYQYWTSQGSKPLKITIETNGAQLGVFQTLRQTTNLPVVKCPTTKGKMERLTALAVYFENGRIRLSPDFDGTKEFRNEWVNFPNKNVHDDCLDSVDLCLKPILKSSGGKISQHSYLRSL